ncbi:hypothetical protein LNP74_30545 [Klebsiella pneumoniae subsp. pneumoniae]|nr:hypothetical protein [Klebsiella pneumoniae subsp. pneumoniae]
MIGNQTLTESDMWGATPIDLLLCRIQFKEMRHQGVFTPPGEDRSLQFPGSLGGMNWGSVSLDPNNSLMFVNDMRLGLANYMVPRAKVAKDASGIEMGIVPMEGTPFGAMRERFLSPLGIPCQKPPFGTMSAVDLENRETGVAGAGWHRRRHRAAGDPYAHANSNRHADPLAHRWQRSPDCCSSPAPRISTCAPLIPRTAKRSGNRVCRSAASPAR